MRQRKGDKADVTAMSVSSGGSSTGSAFHDASDPDADLFGSQGFGTRSVRLASGSSHSSIRGQSDAGRAKPLSLEQDGAFVRLLGLSSTAAAAAARVAAQLEDAGVVAGSILIGIGTKSVVGLSLAEVTAVLDKAAWPLALFFLLPPYSTRATAGVKVAPRDRRARKSLMNSMLPWRSRFLELHPNHMLTCSKPAQLPAPDQVGRRDCARASTRRPTHVTCDTVVLEISRFAARHPDLMPANIDAPRASGRPRPARQVKESVNLVGTSLAYKVESEKNLTIQIVTTAGPGSSPGVPTEGSTDCSPPTTPQAAQSHGQSQSSPPATVTSQNSLMLRGTRKVLGSFGEALYIGAYRSYTT